MILSLARDLYFLARETVGAISEGVALGLKIVRDESPGVDQITHGPAWGDMPAAELGRVQLPDGYEVVSWQVYGQPQTSSTDGAVTDPVVESGPAAAASATDAAAGHPNGISMDFVDGYPVGWLGAPAGHPMDDDLKRILFSAAWGLRQWMIGETCGAPTLFKSIAHDLEDLSK